MNDTIHPRHPYGECATMYQEEPCLARTTVPTRLVEHLVDTGLDDQAILGLLCTLPFKPIVVVAGIHRRAAA